VSDRFVRGLAMATVIAYGGCVAIPVPLPADTDLVRTGTALPSERPLGVTVFVTPDDDRTTGPLGREMVQCITRSLSEMTTAVRVVPTREFYQSLFKLEPEEVLLNEATIPRLLSRADIRQNAANVGITHLILVSGATVQRGDPQFGVIPPVVMLGSLEASRKTRLTASIIDLADPERVSGVEATADGRVKAFMVYPIIVAWGHKTESSSCKALGEEVVRTLRGVPRP
jgi:hypothetical protein